MNTWPPQDEHNALVRVQGRPREPGHAHEPSRWQKLKRVLWPFAKAGGEWAKYGENLAKDFAEAEVAKRSAEAEKLAAEAAKLAEEAETQKQRRGFAVNAEIREIAESSCSDEAKLLQLANLMAENPQIASQLRVIETLLSELRENRGLNLHMVLKDGGAKSLPVSDSGPESTAVPKVRKRRAAKRKSPPSTESEES